MGFIQAIKGSVGGTFADQWKDYYGPRPGVSATSAIFPGVPMGTNNDRGANYKGNNNIITNGSKVIVPEGTALVTMQDGSITNIITEVGGYEYNNNDPNSRSIFSGDGVVDSIVKTSWEKFKFGGAPASQQLLFYVNLKEIPNNRFGTQSEIYWDDAFFNTQVGAVTRGTYTIHIVDPILFIKNFVPVQYLTQDAPDFDFADMDNDAGAQLFNEVVGSLSAAFSNYTNDPSMGNRMSKIQGDQLGFAAALSQAVENAYQWRSSRGLEIVKTAILAIEYDDDTKQLMKDVKKADALSGSRGNAFFQQAAARGVQGAGENGGGGAGLAFMGMGVQATGGMMSGMQQPNTNNSYQPNFNQQPTQGQQGQWQQNQPPQGQQGQWQQNQPPQGQQDQWQQSPQSQEPQGQQPSGVVEQPVPNAQPQQPEQTQPPVDPTAKLIEMKKLLDAGIISQEEFNKVKFELLGF